MFLCPSLVAVLVQPRPPSLLTFFLLCVSAQSTVIIKTPVIGMPCLNFCVAAKTHVTDKVLGLGFQLLQSCSTYQFPSALDCTDSGGPVKLHGL